jgi:flagellar motility protein MotE (MotC chaperone)
MSETERPAPHARLVWDLNVSTIIQAIQVIAFLIAVVYWFVTNANRGVENQQRLAELQASVSSQISEVRQVVAVGLTDVRQQLSSLPDQRARLDQVERRIADVDARYSTLQNKAEVLDRQMLELRSDLNSITRASSVPLPGGRR